MEDAEEETVSSTSRAIGRPPVNLTRDSLKTLQDKGYTGKEMADHFGCSSSLIYSKLQSFGLQQRKKYSTISDEDLQARVTQLHSNFPTAGEKLMTGYLLSEGINVQRNRVREALNYVSDTNTKAKRIRRRVYKVPTPNTLWHMDSYMKLSRWGITTHGCIDGFSRLITFLEASANNRAPTVFNLFVKATLKYGLPSRVRSDHGGENRYVALFMNLVRGAQRHITGRSVHNQRIERLWRDVHDQVTSTYYSHFYDLEDNGELDINNDKHILALQVVYITEINKKLSTFRCGWNSHKIRTEGNKTPEQLWIGGTLRNAERDISAIQGILSQDLSPRQQLEQGLQQYGLSTDQFRSMSDTDLTDDHVSVRERLNHLLLPDSSPEDTFKQVKIFLTEN